MELQKSVTNLGKFRKFLPSKQINEGWHYYKFHGTDTLLGIRVVLEKMYVIVEKGGEPVINPNTKMPMFEWTDSRTESKILTPKQYQLIQDSRFEDEDLPKIVE